MTLQELYAAIGGNYEDVVSRLRSERLIHKFALKFLDDPSYSLLMTSLEQNNYPEAFRAAHTIKGVCQNLSFSALGEIAEQLTNTLRSQDTAPPQQLLEQFKQQYAITIHALKQLQ